MKWRWGSIDLAMVSRLRTVAYSELNLLTIAYRTQDKYCTLIHGKHWLLVDYGNSWTRGVEKDTCYMLYIIRKDA